METQLIEARKPFNSRPTNGLTYDEAVKLVEEIRDYALECDMDEDGLKEQLTEAGFCGEAADVDVCDEVGFKVRVWGPDDRLIEI